MALRGAGGRAAGEQAAEQLIARVVNLQLRPAARRQGGGERVVAAVQLHVSDLMTLLPEVTRANAHVLTIWPALDYVEGDDTE